MPIYTEADAKLSSKTKTPGKFLKLLRSVALFGALPLLVLAVIKHAVLPNKTALITKDGKRCYATTLAKASYCIPEDYFRYLGMPPKAIGKEIFMKAALPDFHAIIPGTPDSPEITKHSWGAVAHLLVTDASSTTSHEFRWENKKRNYGPLTYAGEIFGLQKYVSAKGSAGTLPSDIVVFINNKLLSKPSAEQKKMALEEIYADTQSGVPGVYISCSGDIAFPNPYCSQHFVEDGLMFEIDYGKENLKKWQSIYSNAILMMRMFRNN